MDLIGYSPGLRRLPLDEYIGNTLIRGMERLPRVFVRQ